MTIFDMELMQDFSEIVRYEQAGIPLYIHTTDLSVFPDMCAPCHWHDDLEWIHIVKGKMCYYINGKRIVLNENDCLMVNARQMHYGYSYQKQDCHFSCILFHPSLFCGNKILMQRLITPVLENPGLEYLHFDSTHKWGVEPAEFLKQIVHLKETAPAAYELETIATMNTLWSRLLQCGAFTAENNSNAIHSDLDIQKEMVSFIYQHFGEKISLDEIAAAGHVSRSKCCHIFKQYLQHSPVSFLNSYRLKVSCSLLSNTQKNITEIAFACGFNNLSYFSKTFLECYGCTPREYRNTAQQPSNAVNASVIG